MPVYPKKFFNSKNETIAHFKHNNFYRLDCESGEGLINLLLIELKKLSAKEFNFYLNFILKKCINVNRSFSDAVEFLSIWVEKTPDTLLKALEMGKLKQFFNRTEYDHEGDQWYFPKLLDAFSTLVENSSINQEKILEYLFETFDFFSVPEIFVTEIIGYDRLEKFINESPLVFEQALLLKINEFTKENEKINLGSDSYKYLNKKLAGIDVAKLDATKEEPQVIEAVKRVKVEKLTDNKKLASHLLSDGGLFNYSSFNRFNSSDNTFSSRSSYFRRS